MSMNTFTERRARLAQTLREAGGGLAVIRTAPERPRNADSDHPYRHDSSFHYLTGFDEPGAWLLLDSEGRSTLLCRERNAEREIWDGRRLGPEAAPAALGVQEAFDIAALDTLLPERLANQAAVWFPFGVEAHLQPQIEGWLGNVRARERMGVMSPAAMRDLNPLLAEMRLIKDAGETRAAARLRSRIRARCRSARPQNAARKSASHGHGHRPRWWRRGAWWLARRHP